MRKFHCFVHFILFSCLISVKSDTGSDDRTFQNNFQTDLIQALTGISNQLRVISQNTNNREHFRVINDEIDNIKEENEKLKYDMELLLNDSRREKKRTERIEEILATNIDKLNELQVFTHNLQITTTENFTAGHNLTRILEENLKKHFANHSSKNLENVKRDLDLLNISFSQYFAASLTDTAKDCEDIRNVSPGSGNGVYIIRSNGKYRTKVFCDMEAGGWTVFQRRKDGTENFYRDWNSYRNGFGDKSREYWLGNIYLYHLTQNRNCTLRLNLKNWDNIKRYAEYRNFRIGNEADGFRLSIGMYSGNAGHDSLSYHNGMMFSTRDRDNDRRSDGNCAVGFTGAWWYKSCHYSNLNGNYSVRSDKGVRWYGYPSSEFIKETIMQVKCN